MAEDQIQPERRRRSAEIAAELKALVQVIDSAIEALSPEARAMLDPDMGEYGRDDDRPDWQKTIRQTKTIVDELTFVSKGASGDNHLSDTGVNLRGLRVVAEYLLRPWVETHSTARWTSGTGNRSTTRDEELYSPAERFFFSFAQKIDHRVTISSIRNVIRRPLTGWQSGSKRKRT